jgi:hypothetical protein
MNKYLELKRIRDIAKQKMYDSMKQYPTVDFLDNICAKFEWFEAKKEFETAQKAVDDFQAACLEEIFVHEGEREDREKALKELKDRHYEAHVKSRTKEIAEEKEQLCLKICRGREDIEECDKKHALYKDRMNEFRIMSDKLKEQSRLTQYENELEKLNIELDIINRK